MYETPTYSSLRDEWGSSRSDVPSSIIAQWFISSSTICSSSSSSSFPRPSPSPFSSAAYQEAKEVGGMVPSGVACDQRATVWISARRTGTNENRLARVFQDIYHRFCIGGGKDDNSTAWPIDLPCVFHYFPQNIRTAIPITHESGMNGLSPATPVGCHVAGTILQ